VLNAAAHSIRRLVDSQGPGRQIKCCSALRRAETPRCRSWAARRSPGWTTRVSRAEKELVTCLPLLLQNQRLKIAHGLPDADMLINDMQNFRVKITLAANLSLAAASFASSTCR
jgi:hypothetical protein